MFSWAVALCLLAVVTGLLGLAGIAVPALALAVAVVLTFSVLGEKASY